ncbi:hypothetical protein SeMB42_g03191 [Synchytrium endobioticum]|uniref:Nickel/cobalt efflux system n=1 Tax=Synchytrium endobioticum TaxID=286115 RepID=A0A507D8W2_9FUNG|nr:hypothetical protein SeLEV6574_g07172 [Synchytrium endobioticum]TPX47797.1 hypothetical protein SeMB42_g03191 [Synchytrium endobioticum]
MRDKVDTSDEIGGVLSTNAALLRTTDTTSHDVPSSSCIATSDHGLSPPPDNLISFDTDTPSTRSSYMKHEKIRIVILTVCLLCVNLLLWSVSLLLSSTFKALAVSNLLLAYTLGLRHALDADHITAIDNVTRKLLDDGLRPLLVGFWFSLGHSTIVIVATVAVAVTATTIASQFERFQEVSSIVGTCFSGALLLLIGLINLISLVSICITLSRQRHAAKEGRGEAAVMTVDDVMRSMGVWSRVFRPAFKVIDQSWKMYIVGIVFGLGFDTASEITLLSLASVQASAGFPIQLILFYPLLFTAGMVLVDTLDGILMMRVYSTKMVEPALRLHFNLLVTLLSVVLALTVGIVQILSVIQSTHELKGGVWDSVSVIQDNFGLVGGIIIGIFMLSAFTMFILSRVLSRSHLSRHVAPAT